LYCEQKMRIRGATTGRGKPNLWLDRRKELCDRELSTRVTLTKCQQVYTRNRSIVNKRL